MTFGSPVVLDGAPGTAPRRGVVRFLPSEPGAPGGALRFRLSCYDGNENLLPACVKTGDADVPGFFLFHAGYNARQGVGDTQVPSTIRINAFPDAFDPISVSRYNAQGGEGLQPKTCYRRAQATRSRWSLTS